MKPVIPITDRRFVYTDSASTDIRKTFAKYRREKKIEPPANVRALPTIGQRNK